jgi:hypothetical protein
VRLAPAKDTDAEGVAECLRLSGVRCSCCDSIHAATVCLLTNDVGLGQVSKRVVTEIDEELLLVEMQHRRYMVSISVSSHVHVIYNNELVGRMLPPCCGVTTSEATGDGSYS